MGLKLKIFAILLGVLFLVFVVRALRNSSMRPSNSVLWIGISVFLITIPIFEGIYKWLAVDLIGMNDARHIVYVALIGFLLVYVFYLTRVISRLSNQVLHLLGQTAILEAELKDRGVLVENSRN